MVQNSLSSTSAVTFDIEFDDRNRFEIGYKAYQNNYHSGIFYRAGSAFYSGGSDNEIGINASIGYEHSPAKNIVFFGAVQAEYQFNSAQMVYIPKLGAMLTF